MVKLLSFLRNVPISLRCYHLNVRCIQRCVRVAPRRIKCCSRTISPVVDQARALSDDSVAEFSEAILNGLVVTEGILDSTRALGTEERVRFFIRIMRSLPSSPSASMMLVDVLVKMGASGEGISSLIDMREKCGEMIRRLPEANLLQFDKVLFNVLSDVITFNNTTITPVNMASPPEIIAMVKSSDRVHPILNNIELEHRLADNRSVFILTHDLLPSRPLVILHVAHSRGMFQCVSDVKEGKDRSSTDSLCRRTDRHTNTRTTGSGGIIDDTGRILSCTEFGEDSSYQNVNSFYSISSLEAGLRGIPCGGWCISQAKEVLAAQDTIYTTLSPIPGFKNWLDASIKRGSVPVTAIIGEEMSVIQDLLPAGAAAVPDHLQNTIIRLAVYYILQEKQRGCALDPVCHFHVGNGAVVWALRWGGTRSQEMKAQSLGLMVNYLYDSNSPARAAQYSENKTIVVGAAVTAVLD